MEFFKTFSALLPWQEYLSERLLHKLEYIYVVTSTVCKIRFQDFFHLILLLEAGIFEILDQSFSSHLILYSQDFLFFFI